MSWSSGKDSAYALATARAGLDLDVVALLVTVNEVVDRVAMHAVRRSLLQEQAARLGIPLQVIEIPSPCPNDVYEQRLRAALEVAAAESIDAVIFGDLFLEDVRAYREATMAETGIAVIEPLWGRPTAELARDMLASGVRAIVTCVDPNQLDPSFVGRSFDEAFLADLPSDVDPCGERGEFHTFVWDAPGFSSPIAVDRGEVVEREGFYFCDLSSRTE
jgi:uncharacterized protein (TIGR00290 family)